MENLTRIPRVGEAKILISDPPLPGRDSRRPLCPSISISWKIMRDPPPYANRSALVSINKGSCTTGTGHTIQTTDPAR